ncbi:hypothetical protein J2T15_000854 [Paenibacillus harenae]|uniref:Uncharacterized protein n=1 Tax=Paenibacillus harenae TaxID=306543 RepID=A0ABT9TVM7_PAEHA|nr:hypothetical protein [Paenibacillus harenae]
MYIDFYESFYGFSPVTKKRAETVKSLPFFQCRARAVRMRNIIFINSKMIGH